MVKTPGEAPWDWTVSLPVMTTKESGAVRVRGAPTVRLQLNQTFCSALVPPGKKVPRRAPQSVEFCSTSQVRPRASVQWAEASGVEQPGGRLRPGDGRT